MPFKILIIEDEKNISEIVAKYLEKEGYTTIIANDGIEGLALFRDSNPDLKGNIRDYASINELICLSNLENLNALFINEKIPQKERLIKLNQIAIQQMIILQDVDKRKLLK